MNYSSLLKDLLEIVLTQGASDLHLSVDHPPVIRVAGRLVPLIKMEKLKPDDTKGLAFSMLTQGQQERFALEKSIDISYDYQRRARFRVNVFYQMGYVSCAFRCILNKIATVEELGIPSVIHEFIRPSQGFILITGPSGQGKSTTMAALIDEINHTKSNHIITIEDPIEYIFEDDRSIIDQREVFKDSLNFPRALRDTFRQDPDVIMVGEMRDPETISTAITAAETGHLVLATLHTNSASQTIDRILDSFPGVQQGQIKSQLSGSLLGVVSQRLVPRIKGGLIPACEIMINTPAISNLIREGKVHEMPMVIETSAELGMISLNRYLSNLIRAKEISLEVGQNYSLNPAELRQLVRR